MQSRVASTLSRKFHKVGEILLIAKTARQFFDQLALARHDVKTMISEREQGHYKTKMSLKTF